MARTPDTGLDAALSGYLGQPARSLQARLEVQRGSVCSGTAEFGMSALFHRGRCRSHCWGVLAEWEEDDVVRVVDDQGYVGGGRGREGEID